MPTDRQGQGLFNVALLLDGTPIRPGEWLYADEDGVLIAPGPLC
jgi:regulator of ribonuclease activity A